MARKEEELDLDPIEPEEPNGKNGTPDKGSKERERSDKGSRERSEKEKPDKSKSGTRKGLDDRDQRDDRDRRDKRDDRDDRGEEVRKPRGLMVGNRRVPYPPSPTDVPEGLTDYPSSYTRQQNLLLAGLFVFLVFYIGAVLLFALLGVWCAWSLSHWFVLKVTGIVFCSIFFLFLVKGFFKRPAINKEMHLEITEDEHPLLFAFIDHLCDELGAPLPNKVYVAPDVNAAVMPRTSLINLFVEPKKDLLIGLGLVNSVNLSEFKAVLAHEFGHFSQSAMASSYTYVANRIIADLVEGEDWFDRVVGWFKSQKNVLAIIGYVIGAPLWLGRKILEWFYKAITLQRLAVSREREFHADLVAVSAAGSNAVVHCLLRTEFGHQCFIQALNDMSTALDHKLYSDDMYLHQDRAAVIVRRKKKDPVLGLPPVLKKPNDGKDVEVFDADEEEMEDEIPPMWRTHPSNSDREKNAKEEFVPAIVDHRSPWVLFDDPTELRERMTYKFYRMVFRIPKNANLASAKKVQKFIDNEHADTTYDPKYKGAYDDRPLEPGELEELNKLVYDNPWTDERMEKVLDKLYDGCEEHAEAHSELYKEMQALRNGVVGRPSPKMKKKMTEVEKQQDENWEWFKSFDRRVYLLHIQMAAHLNKDTKEELVERYRFQLEVQRLYQESRAAFNKADAYLGAYAAAQRGEIQVPPDFGGEVIQVLRESWKALKRIIKDAKEINLPAMKNFEEGENLAEFILEGKMVPEPPLSYVKGVWIDKLMTQLQGVRLKCFRLHFKSVGGILRMHEDIAAKWKAMREPVAAEVVETEPIAAEVIDDAQPILADEIPASPQPLAVPVVPSPPIQPPSKAMAAFVTPHVPPAPPPVAPSVTAPPQVAPPPAPQPASVATQSEQEPDLQITIDSIPGSGRAVAAIEFPPVKSPTPPAALAPELEPIEAELIEPAPVAPKPISPMPVGQLKSLDLSDPAPAPVTATFAFDRDSATRTPAQPVATEEIFSLDDDDRPTTPAPIQATGESAPVAPSQPEAAEMPFELNPAAHTPQPAQTPATPAPAVLSNAAPVPESRTPPGSSVARMPTTKPASGKRPPIKITMVHPGETSPLAQ